VVCRSFQCRMLSQPIVSIYRYHHSIGSGIGPTLIPACTFSRLWRTSSRVTICSPRDLGGRGGGPHIDQYFYFILLTSLKSSCLVESDLSSWFVGHLNIASVTAHPIDCLSFFVHFKMNLTLSFGYSTDVLKLDLIRFIRSISVH
jgi:hypothetical protein